MKKRSLIPALAITLLLTGCSGKGAKSFDAGLDYYNKGNYTKAVESYEAAITKDKTKADYYTNLAMAYLELGEYDIALSQIKYALNLDPDNQIAYRCQGIIYIALNDFDSAIASLEKALTYSETFVGEIEYDILDYRAVAEMKSENYEAAIKTYTILLDVGYRLPEHYYLRGSAYLINGDATSAIQDFDKSISFEGSSYDRYLNIYTALSQYGYETEASGYLEKALLIGKNEDYFNKGRIYYYLGDSQNALTNLTTARDKGNTEALLYLGKLYAANGDSNTAFNMFQSYIETNSKSGEVYNQMGMLKFQDGAYEEALSYFETGLTCPDLASRKALLFNEAVTYEYLGDFTTAKQKMSQYVSLYPDDSQAVRENDFLQTR